MARSRAGVGVVGRIVVEGLGVFLGKKELTRRFSVSRAHEEFGAIKSAAEELHDRGETVSPTQCVELLATMGRGYEASAL